MHIHSPNPKRYGLELLIANITEGAFHNAAERDPPRCHPHTRSAIRAEIMEWAKASNAQRKLILWLYGPAGAGKTAITQSIAEECEEEGLLAASFFFAHTAAGRNDLSRFVATLAYQLSMTLPEIREFVLATIEKDPTIFSRSLSVQMQALVIVPVKTVALSSKPRAVVLDGIDECGPDGNSQAELLEVLAIAAAALHSVPILFLGSRPEYEIRLAFNQLPFSSLMKGVFLDSKYQAEADIKRYLVSKFQEVRQKLLMLGTALPLPWPSQTSINILAEKSSGQFIFAATVIKFVDSPRRYPTDRLNVLLGLSAPGNETPFTVLDILYRLILSAVDDLPKVLEVLTLLILAKDYSFMPRAGVVEELLGFEVQRALMDMHALLFVPPPRFKICCPHTTCLPV